MERYLHYAALLNDQIVAMFDQDSDNYINKEKFEDSEEFKHFLHALSTIVPNRFYNILTNDNKNNLEYNHIANHLVFEYANVKNESKEDEESE